ncbi:unnamed protein product [Arabidopsis lyrata]|nr:unnamed protein product [Arabidopsis lyrata]
MRSMVAQFKVVLSSTGIEKLLMLVCSMIISQRLRFIIEDERDLNAPIEVGREDPPPEVELAEDESTRFQEFLARYQQIKDKEAHFSLRNALVDHLWEKYTNDDA